MISTRAYQVGRGLFVASLLAFVAIPTATHAADRLDCTIRGTAGGDHLRGTRGPDVICGLGGPDRIRGFEGDDVVYAGKGDDRVMGGRGADTLMGGAGRDALFGAGGADRVAGQAGADSSIVGGPGPDVVSGGGGADRCLDSDDDEGMDRLDGGQGRDEYRADPGDTVVAAERYRRVLVCEYPVP
jgi:Ca2+-binding RTX toxin-like protein